MQHSESHRSFTSSSVDSDAENLLGTCRPRNRSSLDTFVIPGRTRFPSHKTDPFDEAIVQNLLKSNMTHARDPPPYTEDSLTSLNQQRSTSFPSEVSAPGQHARYDVGESLYRIGPQQAPRVGSCNNIILPHRRCHGGVNVSNSPYYANQSPLSSRRRPTYDGAFDSSHESRVTSTTWSTVSRVSHRIFSDSSVNSRDTSRFHDQYNDLAIEYGLPELALSPMGEPSISSASATSTEHPQEAAEVNPSIKSTTKEHKHGWLSRKLLPRASTTYTYKARTTYRPITRKRSLSRVPSFTDGGRRNILEGKTLEETCRLGGLGILMLPYEYAVDKLTLPTCLSAAATYLLQHGVNAPGLFRVSGQAAIVNALYEYYSHQFGQAGSPSKVQTTVQPGQLPLYIEHALPDVASFFKKILNGLPGGLLGSLGLFEAIRSIFLKLEPRFSQTDDEIRALRAKLVALAVLSVPSQHRFHLIQAVLGLAAYFGQEAETAREAVQSKPEEDPDKFQKRPSSELMGYQALGVCLGPLLVGDLIEKVDSREEATDNNSRPSTDSNQKSKKKRLSIVPDKLERNADLAAHIERANLTASIMQKLLMTWRDVVKQLCIITAPNKTTQKARSSHQLRYLDDRISSGLSVKVSDDELFFLDMMRGGRLPDQPPLDMVMKRKVKAKSRSSMSHLVLVPSEEEALLRATPPQKADMARTTKTPTKEKRKAMVHIPAQTPSDLVQSNDDEHVEKHPQPRHEQARKKSDMECMSMGQMLPSREASRHNSSSMSSHRRQHTVVRTPKQSGSRRSSTATPETAFKDLSSSDRNNTDRFHYQAPSLNKPLPALVDRERRLVLPESNDKKQPFPLRQSSLASENDSLTSPYHPPDALADLNIGQRVCAFTDSTDSMHFDLTEVKAPDGAESRQGIGNDRPSGQDEDNRASVPAAGKVDHELPVVHAFINPLPTPQSPLDDPFTSLMTQDSPRSSLIPRPVKELGHGRQASSRSVSPPKSLHSPKKRQTALESFDRDSTSLGGNPGKSTQPSATRLVNSESAEQVNEIAHTRPLSAYTVESLQRLSLALEEPQTAQHISRRILSFDRGRSASPSRSATNLEPSEPLEGTVRRSGTANATLYAEITRLKKQLEQKTEEILTMRRSLDAARETREQGSDTSTPKRGSWSKGTLSAEVWEIRRDRDIWKKRAEWAEKRLQGLGPLVQNIPNDGREESSGEWIENKILHDKEITDGQNGYAQKEVEITLSVDCSTDAESENCA